MLPVLLSRMTTNYNNVINNKRKEDKEEQDIVNYNTKPYIPTLSNDKRYCSIPINFGDKICCYQ